MNRTQLTKVLFSNKTLLRLPFSFYCFQAMVKLFEVILELVTDSICKYFSFNLLHL